MKYLLDSYKEIINSNISALLSEVKRNRYLEARIAAIRMKPGGLMKLVDYEPEVKVDFNKPATDRIVEYFRDSLKSKDKEAEKHDAMGY